MLGNELSPLKQSLGMQILTANRHLRHPENKLADTFTIGNIGDSKKVIEDKRTGKWFVDSAARMEKRDAEGLQTMMLGAICGDVAGSVYEWHNVKHCIKLEKLIGHNAHFTDDTVTTVAVAEGLRIAIAEVGTDWMGNPDKEKVIYEKVQEALHAYGQRYPHAGYGSNFKKWIADPDPKPYHSWGNGSAMRVSYAGWIASSLEEAERLGEITASITHDHPDGIKAAKAVAGGIYVLRESKSKDVFKEYISQFYKMNFTLDDIRATYAFDVSCEGSVPQAIEAFLEGENFSDVISKAISIGGDSDTIAAIAGCFAEIIYPIPEGVRGRVLDRLDNHQRYSLMTSIDSIVKHKKQ